MHTYHFVRIPTFIYQLALIAMLGIVLGITTVFVSPWAALGLVSLLALLAVVVKMPELGILGMIFLTSTFISSDANPGFDTAIGHIYLTDLILFSLLALTLVRGLVERNFRLVHTPLDYAVLAFVGIAFLSTSIGIAQSSLSLKQSLGEARNIGNYLLFFAVTNLLRRSKQINTLVSGLLILGMLVALSMIIQYIVGPSTPLLPGRVEVLDTEGIRFEDVTRIIPPGYSLVFAAFILLSVIQCFEELRGRRLWAIIPWSLTGLGVVLTFMRHFWVAAIAIFLLLLYLGRAKLKWILGWMLFASVIASIGILLAVQVIGPSARNLLNSSIVRLTSLTTAETYTDLNSSLRWRDFEYEYAAPQIVSHPLLGLGLGARYRPFVSHRDHAGFDGRGFIHNGFLWILVKTGGLGSLFMLCLVTLFTYRGLRYWKTLPTKAARSVVLGFTLVYIGVLIGNIVEPMLVEWRWTALLAAMMGINENLLGTYSA